MQKEQIEQKAGAPSEQEMPGAAEDQSQRSGKQSVAGPAPDDKDKQHQRMPPKNSDELKKWIEALLFAAGRYMTLAELKELCAIEEPGLIREAVKELRADLAQRGSPLAVSGEHDAWKLGVAQTYLPIVEGIMPEMEFDRPLLETLAVIAWRQPILQSEVIKIRSTTAYDHIQELLDKSLITRERYGRSYILKTTKQFEEYFELPGKEAARKLFAGVEGEFEASMKRKERMGDLTVYDAKEPAANQGEEEPHVEPYFAGGDRQEERSDDKQEGALEEQEQEGREEDGVWPAGETGPEEEPDEDEPDERKAQRIIEELAYEDESKEADAMDETVDEGETLHPALERFADKVPLPKEATKKRLPDDEPDKQDE